MNNLFPRPDGWLNTPTHGKTKPADMALFHNAPLYCLKCNKNSIDDLFQRREKQVNFSTDIWNLTLRKIITSQTRSSPSYSFEEWI